MKFESRDDLVFIFEQGEKLIEEYLVTSDKFIANSWQLALIVAPLIVALVSGASLLAITVVAFKIFVYLLSTLYLVEVARCFLNIWKTQKTTPRGFLPNQLFEKYITMQDKTCELFSKCYKLQEKTIASSKERHKQISGFYNRLIATVIVGGLFLFVVFVLLFCIGFAL
jgi:hypothetical protein